MNQLYPWLNTYQTLPETHKKKKEDIEKIYLESQADTLSALDDMLEKLYLLVLQNKEYTSEFHEQSDDFLKKVMILSDKNLICRYMNLALTVWNLPMKPHMMPSFERFRNLYGLHISGTDNAEPGSRNTGSIWKKLFG